MLNTLVDFANEYMGSQWAVFIPTPTYTNFVHMDLSKTRQILIKSLDKDFCGHG